MKTASGNRKTNMLMKKIKNKKAEGLLESETLRVVIAVMCILLLVVLAYKLYGLFTKKTAIEQAKETFDQLVSKMNGLQEGGNDSYMITSPQKWVLMSNGEKICICSFENQGADFFRSANRQEAFRVCAVNGFCSHVKNNMGQFDTCGWGAFQNCIDFKELPLRLYLKKKEGIVSLKTKAEAVIANRLESILNYKNDENSKSIREMIIEKIEISSRIKDAGFFETMFNSGPMQESIEKQKEITASFESYLDTIDTKKEFNCERNKISWMMRMYKLNDKGETEGAWIPVSEKYISAYSKDISNNQVDINGYRIMLNLNCITS